ncbi:BTAD domain-containing putative transcriptional regulator [Micromonospora tarensis]|uniref:LysM peptidoglycan-binding domain-containing protein n=1 Tax=Micromonospora tarensis TaxID=2806100 RepID=A0ABS1Y9D5_9ACTN|nr:BTAD domain-containing putative transcriptional regulator [Micromonospora tarensis]MBM0274008.1 LysM peptidoglycan-binding domain-containing protein [Micromonospora tarensis]
MIATLSKVARRAVGGATLALLLAGVPYALLRYLDPPLPDQPPTWDTVTTALTSPLTDEMIGAVLTALLWAAWASFTWSVLAELAAALTGRRLPQPRVLNPGRGLAALLIAMITGGVLATAAQAATPPLTGPAHAHPGASGVAAATAAVAHRESLPGTTSTQVSQAAATPDRTLTHGEVTLVANGREYVHTVKRGDTLSKIAEQWLGDANRWPEIFALNRGTHFADVGGTLRNPNVIYPGWALDLPADATPPAGQQPRPSTPTPPAPRTPAPETTLDVPPAEEPSASTAPQVPVPSAPTAIPTPTGTASTPTGDATAANPTSDSSRSARPGHGVPLPTGSWIDGGLALAIAAAVAIVWAHRQRRYRARKPPVQRPVTDPDLAPMPRVVRQIRRGLRDAATPTDAPPPDSPADEDNGRSPRTDDVLTDDADAVHEASPAQAATAIDDAPDSGPVAPALAHPLSAVWPAAGLGLTGPGADAAARGFLTAALAAGAAEHPDARTQVVIPATTAATLLGAAAVNLPHTPRLTVTADLDDALEILEEQTLHRTRLAYHHEVDTIAELRAADPFEEPLAPVMLLADATGRHERARIAALLAQGQRLDIHGVLLGAWPDGDTAVVAADGTVTRADGDARHGPHPADVGRLAILDPTETVDVLATLAESHTGQMPEPAPIETPPKLGPATAAAPAPTAVADASDTAGDSTDQESVDPDEHGSGTSSAPHTDAVSAPTAQQPVPEDSAAPEGSDGPAAADADTMSHDIASSSGPREDEASGAGPAAAPRSRVEVTVLGPPAILGANHPRALRAKSMELLVYLAVCDGDAAAEAILEDLLPDAPTSKATHRLHTYVSDLRAVLRQHAGPGTYLTRPHHRYQLNPDSFDIDLWRLRAALRATDGRADRAQALRRAVEDYRPLAEGCDYEWLEPHRHAVQREALDAVSALIEELADQPEQQAAVYDTALPHHPYNEELYQQAMRAHAALGDLDGIRLLRRTLTQRLSEIDAEPTDDTLTLADRLIAEVRSRRGPRSSDGRPSV